MSQGNPSAEAQAAPVPPAAAAAQPQTNQQAEEEEPPPPEPFGRLALMHCTCFHVETKHKVKTLMSWSRHKRVIHVDVRHTLCLFVQCLCFAVTKS